MIMVRALTTLTLGLLTAMPALAASHTVALFATVPMRLESNRPYIDVTLTGPDHKTVVAHAYVDTGGGAIIITSDLAARLNLKPVGQSFTEEGVTLEPTTVPELAIGDMPIRVAGNVRAFIAESRGDALRGSDAQLGLPGRAFVHYDVVFDYPAQRFTVAQSGAFKPRGMLVEGAVSHQAGMPVIHATVGGQSHTFLLDTGGTYSMFSAALLKRLEKRYPEWPYLAGAYGPANMLLGSKEPTLFMLRMADLKLAGVTLHDVGVVSRPAGTYEKSMTQMLGMPVLGSVAGNVLRAFRVQINYPQGHIYMQRGSVETVPALSMVGIMLEPAGNCYAVAALHGSLPGVAIGDRLLQVGNLDACHATLTAIMQALSGQPGELHRLTLERSDKTFTVEAPVVKLF